MIEPFREMDERCSPDEAEAARLLRTLGPAAPPVGVEQRVWARLDGRRRLGPRAMRVATVAAVSGVTTAILAMGVATALHRPAHTRGEGPALPSSEATPRHALAEPPLHAQAPAELPPPPVASTGSRARVRREAGPLPRPHAVHGSVGRGQAVHAIADSAPEETAAPAPSPAADPSQAAESRMAAAPSEEAALVLGGLRALRRAHDPARAALLFGRYLERFPEGTLVEEALALAIEAGVARGDRQAAADLAQQYLRRFPAGRFTRLARQAADRARP